jgi:hypothetical protein
LKEHGIIVVCKPAHTSNITSALDAVPNGRFKYHMQDAPQFPQKRDIEKKLPSFIESVALAAYKALNPSAIKAGFYKAFVTDPSKQKTVLLQRINDFLKTLPQEPPDYQQKKTNRFNISGQELTSDEMIKRMREWESKKKKPQKPNSKLAESYSIPENSRGIVDLSTKQGKTVKKAAEEEDYSENEEIIEQLIEEWIDDDKIIENVEEESVDSDITEDEEDDEFLQNIQLSSDDVEEEGFCSEYFLTKYSMFHDHNTPRYNR